MPATKAHPEQLPAVQSDSASLMAVITRAASDETVDVNKLERLMAMYERITASQAKAAFDAAFAEMQPNLPAVGKYGRITIKEKGGAEKVIQSTPYALFEDINKVCIPVLAEHGFGVSFRVGLAGDGKINVTAILSHKMGHREETTLTLPHDSTGSKNAVQAVGSSVQYGKRYTMTAILNITTEGEDDDGAKGGTHGITEDQCAELDALFARFPDPERTKANFLDKVAKVAALADIPAASFARAKQTIEKRLAETVTQK